MRIGFLSDTHGNLYYTERSLEILKNCEKILHLGDVLAPGPRNPITDGYDAKKLSEKLKKYKNIEYVQGNCDADVDEMVLEKEVLVSDKFLEWGDLKIYATHGYLESEEERIAKARELGADLVVSGHTHIKVLKKDGDITVLNPGSPTLPKDNIRSVAIYENGILKLIDVDNMELIEEIDI